MSIHLIEEGKGPALLLIHAFPLNHAMWAPQISALKSRFRVIAPDVRGFGKTPVNSPWTLNEFADDLANLLDDLNVRDCAVVGLSMGGYIALPFYAKHSHRVRQMVLADTRARADSDIEKNARTEMIAALEQFGTTVLPDRMLPRLLKPNGSPDVVRDVRQIINGNTATACIYALMAMRDRPDASTILDRISCPTLFIVGEYDVVTRVDECRSMAQTTAGSTFTMIPDAGHLSNMENPEAFNSALSAFLK